MRSVKLVLVSSDHTEPEGKKERKVYHQSYICCPYVVEGDEDEAVLLAGSVQLANVSIDLCSMPVSVYKSLARPHA